MDEENRTLTTEYINAVIDTNTFDAEPLIIPQHALNTIAEFFLEQMREEYARNNPETQ